MPKAKFRRTILAAGGIDLPAGTTFAASGTQTFADAFSASKTASFNGAFRVSSVGTSIQKIQTGTANGCHPTLTSDVLGVGSILIPNAAVGDLVFLMPGSMLPLLNLLAACVTAASKVSASFYNSGSATSTESAITFQYILIQAS